MDGSYGGGSRFVMKKHKINVTGFLKYGMLLVIFGYIILLLVQAGGDAPMNTVKEQVLGAVEMKGMKAAGTQDLKKYYGLNANDFEEVVLYLPDNVMSVNELLIIRLRSEGQAEQAEEAAKERLSTQKDNFEGYGVNQSKLLNSAILEGRGRYIFLVVGEDADKAYSAFRKSL